MASVDNDLNLYSELREAVRKVKQQSVLRFNLVPIPGGRKMFIFIHDKTISFSDVDKTKDWLTCLSKHKYTTEEISGNQKEDDRCNTLIPYFRLNPSIPQDHSLLSSNVGLKQRNKINKQNK